MNTSVYLDVVSYFENQRIVKESEKKLREKQLEEYVEFLKSSGLCDI